MARPILRKTAEPCVWMTAGLVSYKLCDRDFDCEHCPLDAALRGEPRSAGACFAGAVADSVAFPLRSAPSFPEACLYTSGHLYLRPVPQGRSGDSPIFRLGLDAFAAALLGRCLGVHPAAAGVPLRAGETCCELDVGSGVLPLGAPLDGRAGPPNRALDTTPEWAVVAPYGDGWLLEVHTDAPRGGGTGATETTGWTEAPHGLLDAERAREQARLDLRHLRRRMALQWLTDPEERDPAGTHSIDPSSGDPVFDAVGPSLADGGVPLVDLRRMLGDQSWLALLRELVH